MSRSKHLRFAFALCVVLACGGQLAVSQEASPPADEAPVLTLDDAVSIALNNNRLVKNSALEAQKYDFRLSTAKTRRLPQFQFAVLGGELMHSFDFTFDQGVFGTYPGVGPIPGNKTTIRNPARFTSYMTGSLDQPVTQQYKIGLGIHMTELARLIAKEDVRAERQRIAAEVRSAYFQLVATQAAVQSTEESVKTLEEAQRVTKQYIVQQTVLRSDALDVDARLAKAQYQLSVSENGLATEREHLNQLLGRDLTTRFQVNVMPEEDSTDLSLESVREKAEQNRPELREAELKEKQAVYDRRLAKAEYIPDLSLSVRYQGLYNVKVLPENVGVAGFYLSWEPFDWGRRRNNIAEKSRAIDQARNSLHETKSQIAVEVGDKYRKWKDAVLLLKATRTGHEATAEQFRVITTKYKEQAALVKDVLQAQARNSEASYQYQQALSAYWTALAELRRAMGEE